jgi:rhodanese-related sulfurtransferase
MTVDELKAKLDREEPLILLDVREDEELALARIPGAVHIPMNELPGRHGELDKAKPIAVLCHSGVRSAHVTHHLRELGYDAANVSGGIDAWSVSVDPSVPRY